MACYSQRGGGGLRYSCTAGMTHFLVAFSQLDTAPFLLIQRMSYIVLYILLVDVLCPQADFWRASPFFAENTGLVVGRTLVNPSQWRVPVLVSNFCQDTVMVEPFSEVGMVNQMSAIQAVMETTDRSPCGIEPLPMHLRDLLDQTSRDLDDVQQRQLVGVLLRYTDLFPTPGSTLTGHTDAVEHEIDTGDGSPIRCAPRQMSPQKMNKEEECVAKMLTSGQTARGLRRSCW